VACDSTIPESAILQVDSKPWHAPTQSIQRAASWPSSRQAQGPPQD
jgi:hypothetical protein